MKALVITIFWVIVVGNYVFSTEGKGYNALRVSKTKSRKLNTIGNSGKTVNNAIKQIRCRRMITNDLGASSNCNIKYIQNANVRSKNRALENKQKFDDIMNLPADKSQEMLDQMTINEWAQVLQQQPNGTRRTFERVIGGQKMTIKSRPSIYRASKNQFYYTINNRGRRYDTITKELDTGLTSNERKQLAKAMLQEMEKTASNSIDFAIIVGRDKAKTASELIILTQIAEAVPGRTPGSDKDFRSVLRSISESNVDQTFNQAVMECFVPASQDGTGLQRIHADWSTLDYNDNTLKRRTESANKKNSRKKQPHTKLTQTENTRNYYSSNSDRRKRQTTQ